ncbi:MAG: DUF1064 domain-containing protein [Muribaculaceae bacterium]
MSKFFNEKIFIVPGAKRPFHNKKDALYYCQDNGINIATIEAFDSKKEYDRYQMLLIMQNQGLISALQRQVKFEIIPEYSKMEKSGVKKTKTYIVNKIPFLLKSYALQHCKDMGLPKSAIEIQESEAPVMKKRIIENDAVYTADFTYLDQQSNYIVEDVKSDYTRKEKDYILRRKLMLHVYEIQIKET